MIIAKEKELKQYKTNWYATHKAIIRDKENSRVYKDFRNSRILLSRELNTLKVLIVPKKMNLGMIRQLEVVLLAFQDYKSNRNKYKEIKNTVYKPFPRKYHKNRSLLNDYILI